MRFSNSFSAAAPWYDRSLELLNAEDSLGPDTGSQSTISSIYTVPTGKVAILRGVGYNLNVATSPGTWGQRQVYIAFGDTTNTPGMAVWTMASEPADDTAEYRLCGDLYLPAGTEVWAWSVGEGGSNDGSITAYVGLIGTVYTP